MNIDESINIILQILSIISIITKPLLIQQQKLNHMIWISIKFSFLIILQAPWIPYTMPELLFHGFNLSWEPGVVCTEVAGSSMICGH